MGKVLVPENPRKVSEDWMLILIDCLLSRYSNSTCLISIQWSSRYQTSLLLMNVCSVLAHFGNSVATGNFSRQQREYSAWNVKLAYTHSVSVLPSSTVLLRLHWRYRHCCRQGRSYSFLLIPLSHHNLHSIHGELLFSLNFTQILR